MEQLLAADKIRPHRGPINGYVHAFTIPQHKKQRWRVIAEPIINATCDRQHIYQVHYPSRLERRARARGARFEAELDFAAYFDQFELSDDVLNWFVLRSKHPVDGETLFSLTRLPMGVTFAPSVAQAVTSVLVMPLIHMEGVKVDTCIDNIRIVAQTEGQFLQAIRVLLQRIRAANVTLNDADDWQVPDEALLRRCRITDTPRKFLGEQYIRDTVSNTEENLDKLRLALLRFQQGSAKDVYTLRNFASLVGLMLFMAHTIDVDLSQYHTLLRAYGTIISDSGGWDKECAISSEAVKAQLLRMAQEILANPRIPLPVLRQPSRNLDDYDAAVEVDASGSAWGAIVRFNKTRRVYTLQQRWTVSMLHSARAEPTAAARALRWVREQLGDGASVVVITDHAAMVTGQRRWDSNYGGFSSSGYHLNEFYRELYGNGGGEVFHVDGEENRADGISRDPTATFTMKVAQADATFRDLQSISHPFEVRVRKEYQV
jgi:ribonuclease HI